MGGDAEMLKQQTLKFRPAGAPAGAWPRTHWKVSTSSSGSTLTHAAAEFSMQTASTVVLLCFPSNGAAWHRYVSSMTHMSALTSGATFCQAWRC